MTERSTDSKDLDCCDSNRCCGKTKATPLRKTEPPLIRYWTKVENTSTNSEVNKRFKFFPTEWELWASCSTRLRQVLWFVPPSNLLTLAQSPILFQFHRLASPQEAACQHGLRGLLGLPGLLDTGVAVSFRISEDAMFALIRGPGSPWEVQLTASTAEVGGMFVCPLLDPFNEWN